MSDIFFYRIFVLVFISNMKYFYVRRISLFIYNKPYGNLLEFLKFDSIINEINRFYFPYIIYPFKDIFEIN